MLIIGRILSLRFKVDEERRGGSVNTKYEAELIFRGMKCKIKCVLLKKNTHIFSIFEERCYNLFLTVKQN